MGKLVIIPTYNEAENIAKMIDAVLEIPTNYHLLIVDDSSPDGTAEIVKTKTNQYNQRLFLLSRKQKSGLGTAYIAGFNWALEREYKYIFEMDADFSHNPLHLDRLYNKAKEGNAVVVGSRYVAEGKILNWPLDRRVLSYGGSMYARLLTQMPIKDPTAGFICYHRTALESIDFSTIDSIGYSFQIEMKYACWKLGHALAEVPITFKDRELGVSKMNGTIIKEAASSVWRMSKKKANYYQKKTK